MAKVVFHGALNVSARPFVSSSFTPGKTRQLVPKGAAGGRGGGLKGVGLSGVAAAPWHKLSSFSGRERGRDERTRRNV